MSARSLYGSDRDSLAKLAPALLDRQLLVSVSSLQQLIKLAEISRRKSLYLVSSLIYRRDVSAAYVRILRYSAMLVAEVARGSIVDVIVRSYMRHA